MMYGLKTSVMNLFSLFTFLFQMKIKFSHSSVNKRSKCSNI